jgi:putative photosynthetic complex assembly protein
MSARAQTAVAPDTFPRWVLFTAGGIIAFTLISVALVRITGNGPDQLRKASIGLEQTGGMAGGGIDRPLRFEDRADGSIAVTDARTGQLVAQVSGEQGFVRGALRALARERKARGIGAEAPFELVSRPDGGLTLSDPVTQQRVELRSFGPTNAGAFAPLLHAGTDGLKPAAAKP